MVVMGLVGVWGLGWITDDDWDVGIDRINGGGG